MAKPSWTDLPPDEAAALQEYQSRNGKDWKDRLCADWGAGRDTPPLRRIRNRLGPKWLSGLPNNWEK